MRYKWKFKPDIPEFGNARPSAYAIDPADVGHSVFRVTPQELERWLEKT